MWGFDSTVQDIAKGSIHLVLFLVIRTMVMFVCNNEYTLFLLTMVCYFLVTLLHKVRVCKETFAYPLRVEVRSTYILPLPYYSLPYYF